MNAVLKAVRWAILHPWHSLGAVAVVIVVFVVINPFGGGTSQDQKSPEVNVTGPTGPGKSVPDIPVPIPPGGGGGGGGDENPDRKPGDLNKPAPDPHDYDPETKAGIEEQLREMPALQGLPVQKPGIYIDLTDMMPDGRPIITVTHKKDELWARQQWTDFLRSFKDSGQAYVVLFKQG